MTPVMSAARAEQIAATLDLRALPPDFYANPYPVYDVLRTQEPVRRMPDGSYFLTRHADLVAVPVRLRLPVQSIGAKPQPGEIREPVDDALRCRGMRRSPSARFKQRIKQPGQYFRLRRHGTQKIQSVIVADQKRWKGFNVQVAHQISTVFDVDPDETAVGIVLRQRLGQL